MWVVGIAEGGFWGRRMFSYIFSVFFLRNAFLASWVIGFVLRLESLMQSHFYYCRLRLEEVIDWIMDFMEFADGESGLNCCGFWMEKLRFNECSGDWWEVEARKRFAKDLWWRNLRDISWDFIIMLISKESSLIKKSQQTISIVPWTQVKWFRTSLTIYLNLWFNICYSQILHKNIMK